MTIHQLENRIAKRLQSFGIENPYLEARWILEKFQNENEIWNLVEKRCKGEPLAYLLQEKGFYKDVFLVKPGQAFANLLYFTIRELHAA